MQAHAQAQIGPLRARASSLDLPSCKGLSKFSTELLVERVTILRGFVNLSLPVSCQGSEEDQQSQATADHNMIILSSL